MARETFADVAVVGLGAMGSATLYQLALQGVDAVGVDRFRPPHNQGSSHGETRLTRRAVGEGADYVPFVTKSHEVWRALEAETGEQLMVPCGVIIMAPEDGQTSHHGKPDFVTRSLTTAREFSIEHEVLGAAEIRERFPHLAVDNQVRGYFEPGAGYLFPEKCVATQLRLAEKHGAKIMTDEPVLSVRQVGDHVEIERANGTIRAGRAIVAAGAWIGPLLGSPFDRLLSVKRQVLQWFKPEADANFGHRPPCFIWMHGPADSDYLYGFPPTPGSSGIKLATEQYEQTTTAAEIDRTVSPSETSEMFETHVRGRVTGVTPVLEQAAVCLYTVTPDFGFVIDSPPGQERILAVSACSGHGFKHSAGIGFAAAAWAVQGVSPIDLSPFSLSRFKPERPS